MEKAIRVEPRYFGPKLRETIKTKLHDEMEGSCAGRFGYVVAVTEIKDIGKVGSSRLRGRVCIPCRVSVRRVE